MPEHRRARRRRHATQVPATSVATSAGAKPFADVEQHDGQPAALRPVDVRQTFVAPMLPLPSVRMSTPLSARTSQYPVGMLPAR